MQLLIDPVDLALLAVHLARQPVDVSTQVRYLTLETI